MKRGLIIKSISGEYTIIDENNKSCVRKPRGIFRHKNIIPKVGDMVEFDDNAICNILERKNDLERPFIANINKVFLVFSALRDSRFLRKCPVPKLFF